MAENYFGLTDTGRQRDNNEDAFIAVPQNGTRRIIACVIDGVGGYEGGEVAAAIARDAILEVLHRGEGDVIENMRRALIQANASIFREKMEGGKNSSMACVLTLALVDPQHNRFHYAHVGDTRLYLLRDASLVKVTKDQSFVGFLEDSGRLSEAEAMSHPKRNEINKALGFEEGAAAQADYIETGESPFLPGDMLLLCSDGLTDMVGSRDITAVLQQSASLEEKGRALIEKANAAGGRDNITVVLVRHPKRPVKQQSEKERSRRPVLVKKQPPPEAAAPPPREQGRPSDQPLAKRSSAAVWVLSFLCLLFLGAALTLYFKNESGGESMAAGKPTRSRGEQVLMDSITRTATGILFMDTALTGSRVMVTDTIYINRDSAYISGGGMTLVRDSAFASRGPAIVTGPDCKLLVLDSMVFEGFHTAVLAANPEMLVLNHTSFRQCQIAVAYKSPLISRPQEQRRDSLSKKES